MSVELTLFRYNVYYISSSNETCSGAMRDRYKRDSNET